MSFVKRTRIVSIRVTPEEYQSLDRVSRRQGANSVSEFVRQIIIHAAPVVAATRRGTPDVSEQLEELRREVSRLSRMVTQNAARPSDRDAIRGESESGMDGSGEAVPSPLYSVEAD